VTEESETARGRSETVGLSKLQQAVARNVAESKATVPHLQLRMEVDMGAAVSERARLEADAAVNGGVPTFNDMLVRACALALLDHPRLNGAYRDGGVELHSRVNIGIAVAAQDAFIVPTLFDADRKGVGEIAAETRELVSRARDGSITPPELAGGTFTISNLGMHGISDFEAVINSGQAAILAAGAIEERPVIRGGAIAPGQVMTLTLGCDHRIVYGADGGEFLSRVRALLGDPVGLAA
jgi:pyruvate dehydrogenase E2 component (dihydrolipoamide acetyltransferase)